MSTNFQKTPLVQSLGSLADSASRDAAWSSGQQYPCTVSEVVGPGIVKVNFQVANNVYTIHQIEMPVAKPPYVKFPIKVGDKGFATSASLSLGQMSGLGGETPDPNVPSGNLSCLAFVWLGNVDENFLDPDAVTVYDNLVIGSTELAFFGGSKTGKQEVTSPATDLGSAVTLVNSIRAALIAYGLVSG